MTLAEVAMKIERRLINDENEDWSPESIADILRNDSDFMLRERLDDAVTDLLKMPYDPYQSVGYGRGMKAAATVIRNRALGEPNGTH